MNSKFESYSKFIAFLSILLIMYGVLYNYIYYLHYGITITQYIDFSEAALLFIPQVMKLLFFIIYTLFVYFILGRPIFINKTGPMGNINFRETKTSLIIICIVYLILLSTFLVLFSIGVIKYSTGFRTLLFIGIISVLPYFIASISFFVEKHYQIKISLFLKDFSYCIIIISAIVINSAIGNLERDKRKGSYIDFEIKYKNGSVFKSDSSYLFLGKTKSYIFIYNYSGNESKAIKDELIEELTFKQ